MDKLQVVHRTLQIHLDQGIYIFEQQIEMQSIGIAKNTLLPNFVTRENAPISK